MFEKKKQIIKTYNIKLVELFYIIPAFFRDKKCIFALV